MTSMDKDADKKNDRKIRAFGVSLLFVIALTSYMLFLYTDSHGYNIYGYNRQGWDKDDNNRYTGTIYDKDGYDRYGWSENHINKVTGTKYDKDGYNRKGYDKDGYDIAGIAEGGPKFGINKEKLMKTIDLRNSDQYENNQDEVDLAQSDQYDGVDQVEGDTYLQSVPVGVIAVGTNGSQVICNTDHISQDEAMRLANFFETTGWGDNGVITRMFGLDKGNAYQVHMFISRGAENNEDFILGCRFLALDISAQVFNGEECDLLLIDKASKACVRKIVSGK